MSNKIIKVYHNKEEGSPEENEIFEFGAPFENIYYEWTDDDNENYFFTLEDMYNYLKDFFSEGNFIKYSNNAPENENIKVWYDTSSN